jgi:hypothetical protein
VPQTPDDGWTVKQASHKIFRQIVLMREIFDSLTPREIRNAGAPLDELLPMHPPHKFYQKFACRRIVAADLRVLQRSQDQRRHFTATLPCFHDSTRSGIGKMESG